MGILDIYMKPKEIEVDKKVQQIRKEQLQRLKKGKSKFKKATCTHEYHFEKWIHYHKNGDKSFHYKEVCDNCGIKRCIERTQEIFKLLENDRWHSKYNR